MRGSPDRVLSNGKHQPIGIGVMRNPDAKGLFRFLKAKHFLFDHLLMELTEIN